MQNAFRGAEIAEYGLIMALIVLISIPAVMFFGEELSSSYNNLNPTGKASQLFALLGGSSPTGSAGDTGMDIGGSGIEDSTPLGTPIVSTGVPGAPATDGGSPMVQTPDRSLSLAVNELLSQGFKATSAEGIMQSVSSMGAAKTTSAVVSNLEDLVDQMEASGEMTAEEASHFRKLANQGHKIAEVERIIEQAGERFDGGVPQGANTAFRAQQVEYQGMTVTVGQLSQLIDWGGGLPTDLHDQLYNGNLDPAGTVYPNSELKTFVELYQQGQQMDILKNNPQLYDYVYSMSATVVNTSEAVGSLWFETGNEQKVKDWLADSLAGQADRASANICGVGQGSDSGTSCK